jgi:phenylacetate-CoA ligase
MFIFNVLREVIRNKIQLKYSKSQIEELQLKKFRELVKYINENSKYYRELIQRNNINIENCVVQDFPEMTKVDLMENFDDIVTDPSISKQDLSNFFNYSSDPRELYKDKYYALHSSGSSSLTGFFLFSASEMASTLANSTRFNSPKLFQKLAYVAATNGHFAGVEMASLSKKFPVIYRDFLPLDINSPFDQILEKLQEFQPTNLSGYAFSIRKIAEAQKSGLINISPKNISVGGEAILHSDQLFIEEVFGVDVVNVYASSEFLVIGVGKSEWCDKLMLMDDYVYTEIYENHCLMTNLFNKTLPLIRYKMSDKLIPTSTPKNAPPGFTFVENIVGREEQTPYFINELGKSDFIHFLTIHSLIFQNVLGYQLKLINEESFEVHVQLEDPNSNEIESVVSEVRTEFEKILSEKKMSNVSFSIKVVEKLWADPKTGKFKLVLKV